MPGHGPGIRAWCKMKPTSSWYGRVDRAKRDPPVPARRSVDRAKRDPPYEKTTDSKHFSPQMKGGEPRMRRTDKAMLTLGAAGLGLWWLTRSRSQSAYSFTDKVVFITGG